MIPLIYGFGIKRSDQVGPDKCAKCNTDPPDGIPLDNGPKETEWKNKPTCPNCCADILIEKRNKELAEGKTDEATIIP